jgi:hypothetical protein
MKDTLADPDYGPLVDTLKQSDLLNQTDYVSLQAMVVELQETFDKAQIFRTRTELEVSVLNDTKFPTPASKYWQAMRDQSVMFTALVMLSYDYRENLINIKLKQLEIASAPEGSGEYNTLKKELLYVDLDRLLFDKEEKGREAKARIREMKNLSEIKKREALCMSEEELVSVDNHQLISYTKRWIKQSVVMGGGGSPSERQNLLGQLRSGILCCIEKGILDKVLEGMSKAVQRKIRTDYGIK